MIHIKIIHQGQRNHKCDYCGKFYTQMTNLKMHLWFLCPRWIILIWIIRLADLVIYFPHQTHLNHQTGWFSDIFSTWNTCTPVGINEKGFVTSNFGMFLLLDYCIENERGSIGMPLCRVLINISSKSSKIVYFSQNCHFHVM